LKNVRCAFKTALDACSLFRPVISSLHVSKNEDISFSSASLSIVAIDFVLAFALPPNELVAGLGIGRKPRVNGIKGKLKGEIALDFDGPGLAALITLQRPLEV